MTGFTESIRDDDRMDKRAPTILDMGCGFGKSTRPFWDMFPDSHITGVDLAAPGLRVAASEAARDGRKQLVFRQADARETGCADESIDLVTSTMLLHEMTGRILPAAKCLRKVGAFCALAAALFILISGCCQHLSTASLWRGIASATTNPS